MRATRSRRSRRRCSGSTARPPKAGWWRRRRAARPEPGRADVGDLLDRADALRRQGDDAAAEREYAKALRADPDSTKAHLGAGARSTTRRGSSPRPSASIPRRSRIDPNDASAFVGRAIAHGAAGNLTAALADYEQAIRINPNLAVAYVGQGAILARLNRPDEAIAACSRAIALDAKNAKAYYNRGGRPRGEEGHGGGRPGLPEGRPARSPPEGPLRPAGSRRCRSLPAAQGFGASSGSSSLV